MNIKEFIVDNLVLLYKGSFSQKLLASAQLSLAPAAALTLTERISGWYVESEFFLFCLCVVLAIDHVLDSYVHLIILKDFTFKGNLKELITKLSIISMGFIILSVINKVLEPIEFFKSYFSVLVQLMVILYPGATALTNMSVVTGGRFPPSGLLDKIKNFHNSGDIDDLKSKKKMKSKISHRIGFWLLLACLLLSMVSCGSRKAVLEKEKSEISIHEAEREKKDSTGISQTREHEEYSSISMDSGFSITPIGNTPAEFSFFYNGKEVKGKTTGKLDFNNKKDLSNKKTDTYKTDTVAVSTDKEKETQTKAKTETKSKQTERRESWWVYFVIFAAGGLCWEFLRNKIF